MRIEGKDYTQGPRDALVIKLPKPPASGALERLARRLGLSDDGFGVSVLPPTKRLYDELGRLAEGLEAAADGDPEGGGISLDEAQEIAAHLMSRNAEKIEITPAMLDGMGFDLEDVGEFIGSYLFFVNELVRSKN